jgi:hypothetical protein
VLVISSAGSSPATSLPRGMPLDLLMAVKGSTSKRADVGGFRSVEKQRGTLVTIQAWVM